MNKQSWQAGKGPPIIGMIALLLTIAALGTTPLALSKYKATGTGSARARVARWDVSAGELRANCNRQTLISDGTSTYEDKIIVIDQYSEFYIGVSANNEVLSDVAFTGWEKNGAGAFVANSGLITMLPLTGNNPPLTAGTGWRYPFGSASYNLPFEFNLTDYAVHTIQVRADAVQVD